MLKKKKNKEKTRKQDKLELIPDKLIPVALFVIGHLHLLPKFPKDRKPNQIHNFPRNIKLNQILTLLQKHNFTTFLRKEKKIKY